MIQNMSKPRRASRLNNRSSLGGAFSRFATSSTIKTALSAHGSANFACQTIFGLRQIGKRTRRTIIRIAEAFQWISHRVRN